MSTTTRHAPAKINLSLRVLGKREDGFHDIDTTMVKLPGLADILEFSASESFSFHCDASDLPGDESNLVVKAVRAYEKSSGISCRFSIHLKKHIPHGAGLGGGSSDAAAALLELDQLHGGPLGETRLLEIAARLGSDVPFFLASGAMRCTGRGEILTAIPAPPSLRLLLLKPSFSVPTPDAYARWSDSAEIPGIHYATQETSGVRLVNDLEKPVFHKHRYLAELKQWLIHRREISAALLCGSGSTIFAVLHVEADAMALVKCAHHEIDPGLWYWTGLTGV